MKKHLLTLLFSACIFAAGAQIQYLAISSGTNGGDNGTVGGYKINTNFWFTQSEILTNTTTNAVLSFRIDANTAAIAAVSNLVVSGGATNLVYQSHLLPLLSTNPFTFTGSNYIGQFTNVIAFTAGGIVSGSGGGMTPGTTLITTNIMSTDGGTTWQAWQPTVGPVELAVLTIAGVGGVIVNATDHPELIGVTNSFFGQHWQFANPINPSDGANKAYVDARTGYLPGTLIQLAPEWNMQGQFNATNSSLNFFLNQAASNVLSMSFAFQSAAIASIALDGTGTNVILGVTNSTPSGWQIYVTTNLLGPVWLPLATNGLSWSTNSGIISATFPMPNQSQAFFKVAIPGAASIVATVPVAMPFLSLAPFTVTHSTNSTMGYGAGLVACDQTNIYVSIGTNAWRRLALATNSW